MNRENETSPASLRNLLLLAVAILAICGLMAGGLFWVTPSPHSTSDLLLIGGVALFVGIFAIFVVLVSTSLKIPWISRK